MRALRVSQAEQLRVRLPVDMFVDNNYICISLAQDSNQSLVLEAGTEKKQSSMNCQCVHGCVMM